MVKRVDGVQGVFFHDYDWRGFCERQRRNGEIRRRFFGVAAVNAPKIGSSLIGTDGFAKRARLLTTQRGKDSARSRRLHGFAGLTGSR